MTVPISEPVAPTGDGFVDRRGLPVGAPVRYERRQFANSHDSLHPAVAELARAIDEYKLRHRRRFITYEEMYDVISSLGYQKKEA